MAKLSKNKNELWTYWEDYVLKWLHMSEGANQLVQCWRRKEITDAMKEMILNGNTGYSVFDPIFWFMVGKGIIWILSRLRWRTCTTWFYACDNDM